MTHPPGCVTPAEDLLLTQQGGDLFVGNYPVPKFEELRHEPGEVGWIYGGNLWTLGCTELISQLGGSCRDGGVHIKLRTKRLTTHFWVSSPLVRLRNALLRLGSSRKLRKSLW